MYTICLHYEEPWLMTTCLHMKPLFHCCSCSLLPLQLKIHLLPVHNFISRCSVGALAEYKLRACRWNNIDISLSLLGKTTIISSWAEQQLVRQWAPISFGVSCDVTYVASDKSYVVSYGDSNSDLVPWIHPDRAYSATSCLGTRVYLRSQSSSAI